MPTEPLRIKIAREAESFCAEMNLTEYATRLKGDRIGGNKGLEYDD